MYFIGAIILFLLVSKEYLIINQEIIIYITFISLLILAISGFKLLSTTFDNTRQEYIKTLQNTTVSLQMDLKSSYNKSDFFSELIYLHLIYHYLMKQQLTNDILELKIITNDDVEDTQMWTRMMIMKNPQEIWSSDICKRWCSFYYWIGKCQSWRIVLFNSQLVWY
jgi:hypothetical protein